MICFIRQSPQCRWVLYVLHAVEHYCTPTAVGPTVLPSIKGFLTVVAAGRPPLLLLCGVVLCVERWKRALSLLQINIKLIISMKSLVRTYSTRRTALGQLPSVFEFVKSALTVPLGLAVISYTYRDILNPGCRQCEERKGSGVLLGLPLRSRSLCRQGSNTISPVGRRKSR